MSATHTPGPWQVADDDACTDWKCDHPLVVATDAGNELVVQIASIYERGSQDINAPLARVAEANARLIAAAPELLAALIDAADFLERSGAEMNEQANEVLEAARAAIAKAEPAP